MAEGRYGPYGGQYVPESLMAALEELKETWVGAQADSVFQGEVDRLRREYAGRPTPLTPALRLGEAFGGVRVYLKREDLNHTGSHKLNNCLGQALLARRMGKQRVVAETGAGQHGVAAATACALLGLDCVIYMGAKDLERQALNRFRMELLGAEVRAVEGGSGTLKDAINEAIRDWVTEVETTYYLLGSVVGPHPYPEMVAALQSVIGEEAREELLAREESLPAAVVACVGGGSNALGMFRAFLEDECRLVGVEGAGEGLESGAHSASLGAGRPGVLHGAYTYVLQDEHGQVRPAHSVAAGLDYPGVGPEHAYLKESGRVEYVAVTDREALEAFRLLSRLEGIIPALESAHAVAYAERLAEELEEGEILLVCLSGRGDKDVQLVADLERRGL